MSNSLRTLKRRLDLFQQKYGLAVMALYFVLLTFVMRNSKNDSDRRSVVIADDGTADQKPVELYHLMVKQYDVPHGAYEGVPYKKILYWNQFISLHDNQQFGMGVGRNVYRDAGCPVWQCETSQDRTNLHDYDAILFHSRGWNASDLPTIRLPNQRYIFFAKEAPAWDTNDAGFANMNNFFNWTMTYRWDSDVVHPYGWFQPNSTIPLHPKAEEMPHLIKEGTPLVNYAAGKSKMAVWFITNCRSMAGRDEMVDQLARYIQVDRYGSCGNLTCGVSDTDFRPEEVDEQCREMAAKTYKFYLALENSLCADYVSERFFSTLRYPIIPIIVDAHGHHAKTAPPHSYINALDFPSVKKLAEYLVKLDQDDKLYNEYFWWKSHFEIRNGNLYTGLHYRTFCSLCAALHDPFRHSNQRHLPGHSYPDMMHWWRTQSECKSVLYDGMYATSPPQCSPANRC